MDLSFNLTGADKAKLNAQVEAFNNSLSPGKASKQELGKDDFLRILITQLQHQDPTSPMEDREFIAQMAQFSALEQMTNMSNQFSGLAGILNHSSAINLLGKEVEIELGDRVITGTVQEVSGKDYPQVMVDGVYYDYNNVQKVIDKKEAAL